MATSSSSDDQTSGPRKLDLEALVKENPVLSNGFRLFQDAEMLFLAESYQSCVALAILALEEVGKYLLEQWRKSDPAFSHKGQHTYHQAKQAAVVALMMTEDGRREFRKVKPGPSATAEELAVSVRAMIDGIQKRTGLANAVAGGIMSTIKGFGFYYDQELPAEMQITEKAAREIMGYTSESFSCLETVGNVEIAQMLFSIVLRTAVQATPR